MRPRRGLRGLLPWLALLLGAMPAFGADMAAAHPQIRDLFPAADRFEASEGTPPASAVYAGAELLGYVFFTDDMVRIPAYSGHPVNLLVGIDIQGRIAGARIAHHEEPILAAGISEEQLAQFVDQYRGKPANGRILVGAKREGYATVDAITGATISIMVINATITRSARLVAESRGIGAPPVSPSPTVPAAPPPAAVPPAQAVATAPTAAPSRSASNGNEAPPAARTPETPAPALRIGGDAPDAAARKSTVTAPVASIPIAPTPTAAAPIAAVDEAPIWRELWRQRKVEIALLVAGLAFLTWILLFQDYLARRPSLLRRVRIGFLMYTLFFIGWYGLAQLSIVNVLTFVQAVTREFSWETFLIDPMLFILWSFVAIALLLWGRGVYCGWLCPFGALQELAHQLAQKFRLPSFDIPHVVHERMLALKFVILLVLFGLSLQSMEAAVRAAEIEPFKTAIILHFQREWGFVAFALGVLMLSVLNRKFYCKYICPLGAALVIPGRFHSFEWLRRRKECGKPCQVCAVECEVQAIRPTGEINVNECHQCLDCQVTYYNDRKCPPLVEKRKRRERSGRARTSAAGREGTSGATRLREIPVTVAHDAEGSWEGESDNPCRGCRVLD